jgi:hypothetical protein
MDMSGIGQHGGKRLPPRSPHRPSFATQVLKPHAAFALLIACIPIRQKMISLLLIQIFYWRLESQKKAICTNKKIYNSSGPFKQWHYASGRPFYGRPN